MVDLKKLKFKVIIKKKGRTRGVTKYFSARTFDEIERYSINFICNRHQVSYKDHYIIGEGPKLAYIVNDQDHVVLEYMFELGININKPINYYIDMKIDDSVHKSEGAYL